MMQEINSWAPRLCRWMKLGWLCLQCETCNKTWNEMGYTGVVFSKNTPMIKSEKEKVYREKLT